jgi:type IV pilus assembly protein PilM
MARRTEDFTVAVEVTTRSVHALACAGQGAARRIRFALGRPLPPPEASAARGAALDAALREIAERAAPAARVGRSSVILILSGPSVTLRHLDLPPMPEREIPPAVAYRLHELCNIPPDRACVDIRFYGERAAGRVRRSEVLVAAIERGELARAIEPLARAGLTPTAAIPAGAALAGLARVPRGKAHAGAAGARDAEGEASVRALLHIGDAQSGIVLLAGDRVLLAREIAIGDQHFNHALERELGVNADEAEKLKRAYGIPAFGEGPPPGADPEIFGSLRNTLGPVAERLLGEVRRSAAFLEEERSDGMIGELWLTGGGAALGGLAEMLAEGIRAPVGIWEPDARLDASPPESGKTPGTPRDGTCSGEPAPAALCLGAAWAPPEINLLAPSRPGARPRLAGKGLVLAAAGVAAVAGLVGWLRMTDARLAARIHDQESRIAALAPGAAAMAAVPPETLAGLASRENVTGILTALDSLVPAGLRFDTLSLLPAAAGSASDRGLRVEGTIGGSPRAAEGTLARFLEDVETAPAFRNVQRVKSDRTRGEPSEERAGGTRGMRFAFTCEVDRAWNPPNPDREER